MNIKIGGKNENTPYISSSISDFNNLNPDSKVELDFVDDAFESFRDGKIDIAVDEQWFPLDADNSADRKKQLSENNIDYIAELHEQGKAKIVLTTSRPERLRQLTIMELQTKGIPFDELVMGLPHCQRVIINDFARSNPYPSCKAINIPRNTDDLMEYFL